jgi:hypothetical protein
MGMRLLTKPIISIQTKPIQTMGVKIETESKLLLADKDEDVKELLLEEMSREDGIHDPVSRLVWWGTTLEFGIPGDVLFCPFCAFFRRIKIILLLVPPKIFAFSPYFCSMFHSLCHNDGPQPVAILDLDLFIF